MKKCHHYSFLISLLSIIALSACVGGGGASKRVAKKTNKDPLDRAPDDKDDRRQAAGVATATEAMRLQAIMDPISKTFKNKANIPRNYNELLIIQANGLELFKDKHLKIKFYFGREKTEVVMDAVIGRSDVPLPRSDKDYLIVDMRTRPFRDIVLYYNLFDYNDYRSGKLPVQDPNDLGLYCRGLKLEYDPTYKGLDGNSKCDSLGEVCYYAYAKIRDKGLIDDAQAGVDNIIFPSFPQIDLAGAGYDSDRNQIKKFRCLPDSGILNTTGNALVDRTIVASGGVVAAYNGDVLTSSVNNGVTISTGDLKYSGPYHTVNTDEWEIDLANAVGTPTSTASEVFALFEEDISGSAVAATKAEGGVKSYLFPRAGKMELKSAIEHLASSTSPYIGITRSVKTLLSGTSSEYMDGCNLRVTSYDKDTNNDISSCNVTAYMRVFQIDPNDGTEVEISHVFNGEDTGIKLKLQLIRDSKINQITDTTSIETVIGAFKSCYTSRSCASGECCYGNRCWKKPSQVSHCLDDSNNQGLLGTGEICSSDHQCTSLCCATSGRCAVHQPNPDDVANEVICNKPAGSSCVAKEWCQKTFPDVCKVYKVGTNATGANVCALVCIPTATYGDCLNGICQPSVVPTPETFDPADQAACNEAPDFPGP